MITPPKSYKGERTHSFRVGDSLMSVVVSGGGGGGGVKNSSAEWPRSHHVSMKAGL